MRPPIPKAAVTIVAPIGLERKEPRYHPFDPLLLVGPPHAGAAAIPATVHLAGTDPIAGYGGTRGTPA
jgi:hypothetical protein